jgi:hypothetical protein
LRERVKSEPYAKMLGLELVKVGRGYALIRNAEGELMAACQATDRTRRSPTGSTFALRDDYRLVLTPLDEHVYYQNEKI